MYSKQISHNPRQYMLLKMSHGFIKFATTTIQVKRYKTIYLRVFSRWLAGKGTCSHLLDTACDWWSGSVFLDYEIYQTGL